ncbi:hypothetical protein LINPERHAP1_LOCUS4990 [Linum perenne]
MDFCLFEVFIFISIFHWWWFPTLNGPNVINEYSIVELSGDWTGFDGP